MTIKTASNSEFIADALEISQDDLNTTEYVSYTTVWEDYGEVVTSASMDTNTGLIFNIDQVEDDETLDGCDHCEHEFVTLRSGLEFDVLENEGEYYIKSPCNVELFSENDPELSM